MAALLQSCDSCSSCCDLGH